MGDAIGASWGRNLVIGISLANLCYLRVWSEVLTYKREHTYWMERPPKPEEFGALMLNVILLGVLLGGGATAVARWGGPRLRAWAGWLFLLLLAVPLNAVRAVLSLQVPGLYYLRSPIFEVIGVKGVLIGGAALFLAGVAAIIRWRPALQRFATGALTVLAPFVLVTFGQGLLAARRFDMTEFVNQPPAAELPPKGSARVVWLIFDELDYRLAFVDRDPTLELPEFDRLRKESFFGRNVLPPGHETAVSMPAFITGRPVAEIRTEGPGQIKIRFQDEKEWVAWKDQPNVFTRARAAGFNSAVAGWFHSYCRVFSQTFTECQWWPMAMQYNSMGRNFPGVLAGQARSLFETNLFSVFGQSLPTVSHVRTYQAMLALGKKLAADPCQGLVLVHLPVPHAPHAYDRKTGEFSMANSPVSAYTDSLALADRALGELRRVMEEAEVWDRTLLVVSSDHAYRSAKAVDGKEDPRVPFLARFPGKPEGVEYTRNFNAVVTHDVLLETLAGRLGEASQLAGWLDRRRSVQP